MTVRVLCLLVSLCFLGIKSMSQKTYEAVRLTGEINVDGKLEEPTWHGDVAEDFIQYEPNTWDRPSQPTEIIIRYDDEAIYVGARMLDTEVDGILREMAVRDGSSNADRFSIAFDTYKDGINAFVFSVNAAGVQSDSRYSSQGNDSSWDAVWESDISRDSQGWYVEMRIPYNAIRFALKEEQVWGMQASREIRRYREESLWNPRDPNKDGFVNQFGTLTGIKEIKPPFRLQLTPYVSSYYNFNLSPKPERARTSETAYALGADVKLGLSDAFTLDMTLVPDFGQTISDNNVLNLSPFEVFFEENRPFFTEGLEIFNKGNLFYTRRVGGRPINYFAPYRSLEEGEVLVDNPSITKLINATKISGRTKNGTGIGVFNAITAPAYAEIRKSDGASRRVQTSPLTNYNVMVVDQNLKNNSYVSLVNTHVWRFGEAYDAWVTGLFTAFNDKDQKYGLRTNMVMTNRYDTNAQDVGYNYRVQAGKYSGLWTYNITTGLETDNYNPNDLGFLFAPNSTFHVANINYNEYTPKNTKLNLYRYSGSVNYNTLYKPLAYNSVGFSGRAFWLYQSRDAFGVNLDIAPMAEHDYFEPRTVDFSTYLVLPAYMEVGGFYSSDYRRVLALDVSGAYKRYDESGRYDYQMEVSPRVRFSDRFSVFLNCSYDYRQGNQGYVNNATGGVIKELEEEEVLIGARDRSIWENTIRGQYIFTPNMAINLRVRHYWDQVKYTSFFGLGKQGESQLLEYDGKRDDGEGLYDNNANFFNIDLQYQWRFAPGSDLFVVWKNSIFDIGSLNMENYFRNLGNTLDQFQSNSISLRAVYFLDYQRIFG